MGGKGSVDRAVDDPMLARQSRDEAGQHFAGRAIAWVPADPHWRRAFARCEQALDIVVEDRDVIRRAAAAFWSVFPDELCQCGAVDRILAEQQLEAVLLGRIV